MSRNEHARKIRVAEDLPTVQRAGNYRTWVNCLLDLRLLESARRIDWTTVQGEPVNAEISLSGWIAQCDCRGAMPVSDAHGFYCVDCQNASNDGHPRPVAFPPNRAEIEAALLQRPDPVTRNWKPGQSVDDLRQENATRWYLGERGLGEATP